MQITGGLSCFEQPKVSWNAKNSSCKFWISGGVMRGAVAVGTSIYITYLVSFMPVRIPVNVTQILIKYDRQLRQNNETWPGRHWFNGAPRYEVTLNNRKYYIKGDIKQLFTYVVHEVVCSELEQDPEIERKQGWSILAILLNYYKLELIYHTFFYMNTISRVQRIDTL